jgi:hypothetical protein
VAPSQPAHRRAGASPGSSVSSMPDQVERLRERLRAVPRRSR